MKKDQQNIQETSNYLTQLVPRFKFEDYYRHGGRSSFDLFMLQKRLCCYFASSRGIDCLETQVSFVGDSFCSRRSKAESTMRKNNGTKTVKTRGLKKFPANPLDCNMGEARLLSAKRAGRLLIAQQTEERQIALKKLSSYP